MLKSFKNKLIKSYNQNIKSVDDHIILKWSSKKSMMNRYNQCNKLLPTRKKLAWLDVGCGTGILFQISKKKIDRYDRIIGLDVNKKILEIARKRNKDKKIQFINKDLISFDAKNLDIITLIGVLQNCGETPEKIILKISELIKIGGIIILNFKTENKKKFKKKDEIQRYSVKNIKKTLINNKFEILKSFGFDAQFNKRVNSYLSGEEFICAKKKGF